MVATLYFITRDHNNSHIIIKYCTVTYNKQTNFLSHTFLSDSNELCFQMITAEERLQPPLSFIHCTDINNSIIKP